MAEKDISEKILINLNDVFADIINGLLFEGEERIHPSTLKEMGVHAQYKADDNKLHEEERDVLKLWKECGIEIAIFGIENQSKPFRFMPVRCIGYDGASYRSQILDKKIKNLRPVITLVLNFGMERWTQPKSLKELFGDYPNELEEYVNDYKIHVFDIAWLSDEEINRFKGDFRVVANFFAMKRRNKNNKDYIPDDPRTIKHVDEVLKLLTVMTGDESYQNIQFHKKGGISMCDVAQNLINKGEGLGAKKQRQEDEAEIAEKDAIIAQKEDELKAAKEALNNEKNRMHDQFIQRQIKKGFSKEEAEAEYSLTFPNE